MRFSRKNYKKAKIFQNPIDRSTKMLYNISVVRQNIGGITMKSQEILKTAMENEKVTQKAMADAMGLKSPQAIGNIIYRENSVRVNSFVKMLNLMGYEVVVRKAGIGEREEWKVEV